MNSVTNCPDNFGSKDLERYYERDFVLKDLQLNFISQDQVNFTVTLVLLIRHTSADFATISDSAV